MRHLPIPIFRSLALGVAILAIGLIGARPAAAVEATLIVEADTGKVLHAEHATYPWYPASTTKLMTMYLTLKAVKDKRLTLDTLLTVSPNAVAQAPSKMGFRAGTQVTVDNALKMLMVKSANDMAVVLAEGVAGSIEKFRRRDERGFAAPRHDAVELGQSERAAGRRADHLGARHGDARARHPARGARIRALLAHPGDQVRPPRDAQHQRR